MFYWLCVGRRELFKKQRQIKKTVPTEQMNILYLERLEFPLFVQMAKKSDALAVLLEKNKNKPQ